MDILGFIGAGRMASAMLDTLLDKRLLPARNLLVFDTDPTRLTHYADQGVQTAASNRELVARSVMIVLAVKPQVLDSVLDEISPDSAERRFISIAAGVPAGHIRERLDKSAFVVRVMPNAPLAVSAGATVIARDDSLPPEMLRFTEMLFSHMGTVTYLPEDKLDEVIGVSSSSPAFFFRMARVMAEAALEQGIPFDTALSLACQSMYGSAKMLAEGAPPEELVSLVASPGGTTMAALDSLDSGGFYQTLRKAMLRCTERAHELGRG